MMSLKRSVLAGSIALGATLTAAGSAACAGHDAAVAGDVGGIFGGGVIVAGQLGDVGGIFGGGGPESSDASGASGGHASQDGDVGGIFGGG